MIERLVITILHTSNEYCLHSSSSNESLRMQEMQYSVPHYSLLRCLYMIGLMVSQSPSKHNSMHAVIHAFIHPGRAARSC